MSVPAKVPVGLLVKVALAALAVGAVAVFVLRGVDVRGLAQQGFEWVRGAGPWVFFGTMVVLPALGFPLSLYYLAAGPAFGEQMGMPGVIAAAMSAIALNLALTYWLSHRGVRPLVEWLLRRTPYRVPKVRPDNELAVAILVRTTPGPPFFLQGYILGLAGVSFRTYMLVPFVVQSVIGTGFILFGRALMEGKGRMAMIGVLLLVAMLSGVQIVRRKLAKHDAGDAAKS
jgi:uncharacterized membrane protein YdjX (TVP38/TMEM64 family)